MDLDRNSQIEKVREVKEEKANQMENAVSMKCKTAEDTVI